MHNTALRRVSTQASTTTISSRPAASIRTRHSTDSRLLEDVFNPGDELGPGLSLFGQPIAVVHARQECVPSLRILHKLGTGSYAVVYLAEEIVSTSYADNFLNIPEDDADGESPPISPKPAAVGRQFAVKCLAKHAQDQEAQLLEASIHQSLPVHPSVVTLHTTLETSSYLLLVLDYVPGEDLFYFLEQWRDHDQYVPGSTSPSPSLLASLHSSSTQLLSYHRLRLIASMFSQMCDAVAHCHRNGVFHRDIKPENFMVTDSRVFNPVTGDHERKVVVKLTDFGLATRDAESGDMDCGSAPYMSFECHNNTTPTYATAPADVWSLGIVLINMLYHANPWLTTAIGQCQSFDFFLSEPIRFFMDRFPGMTPAVAEFFARRVFCLLDPSNSNADSVTTLPSHYPVGHRITAEQFGVWARDLPLHLGPSARRTPAIAFQQTASTSRPRSPTDSSRLMPSVSQPGTRTPSPSLQSRLPVHADAVNPVSIDSEDEDELENERTRTTSSTRRKRAPRGKSKQTSQPPTPAADPSGLTSAALYAASIRNNAPVVSIVDDRRLDELAEKSQMVAREASAIRNVKTAPFPAYPTQQNLVAHMAVTTATPAPSTVNTARSTPELRPKRSMKWTDIFKRDSASDQEVPTAAEVETMDAGRDSLSSPVEVNTTATPTPAVLSSKLMPTPTPTAKNVSNLIMSLSSTVEPPPEVPVSIDDLESWRSGASPNIRSSSLSSRGRRKDKRPGGTDRDGQRNASPSSFVSNSTAGAPGTRGRSAPSGDRRARSKSPTQASLNHLAALSPVGPTSTPELVYVPEGIAPPVPTVPEAYRAAVPVPVHVAQEASHHGELYVPPQQQSNRRSYAPSIASVSTATTSSSGFTAFSSKYKRTSASSRYSGSAASVRSVSTNATSVSSGSGSWRVSNGKKGPPPPLPATNIKAMDGIPWELDALPRQMHHKPKEHVIASEPKKKSNNNRRRPPSAPTSPTPGSSFGLDTISERPRTPAKSAMKAPWTGAPPSMPLDNFRSDGGYIAGFGGGIGMGEFDTDMNANMKSFGARRPGTSSGLSIDTAAANGYNPAASTTELAGAHGMGALQNAESNTMVGGPAPAGKPKTPKWGFMKPWRK